MRLQIDAVSTILPTLGEQQSEINRHMMISYDPGSVVLERLWQRGVLGHTRLLDARHQGLHAGRLSYPGRKKRRMEGAVQLFGRNVFNRSYPVNITHGVDTVSSFSGMGATYGATIGVRL